jgi:hypothetical protein
MQPMAPNSQRVELFFSARNLKDRDTFSKSDPFCIIYSRNPQGNWYSLGQTNVLNNNLNPDWAQSITIDYYFEMQQHLRIDVVDYDEGSAGDRLGWHETTVAAVVAKGTYMADLQTHSGHHGKIIVRAEEVRPSRDVVHLQLRGHKLDKKDFFGKSDPYLNFFRLTNDGSWVKVHTTEYINNTLNPVWAPFEISAQSLCNGNYEKPIKIECFDKDSSSDELIGIAEFPARALLQHGNRFDLKHPSKVHKKKYTNSGQLEVATVIVRQEFSFIDYLRGGVQVNFMVAIDFTASNGEYSQRNSLHYHQHGQMNEYERAIWAVGGILEFYDSDKLIPVFGFGGVPRGQHHVNHCFSLTGDESNPYVPGVPGVVEAYHRGLETTSLSGPTHFSGILERANHLARNTPPGTGYHILLILTDGAIHDMEVTKSLVVDGSCLPLSVIIVGVGGADFDNMEQLDADKKNLTDNRGRKSMRDIVQFVPFRRLNGNPEMLAREVLAEVPKQLTSHMKIMNIIPRIPESVPMDQVGKVDPQLLSSIGGLVKPQ